MSGIGIGIEFHAHFGIAIGIESLRIGIDPPELELEPTALTQVYTFNFIGQLNFDPFSKKSIELNKE